MARDTTPSKRQYCDGCRNNFYNAGQNKIGVDECWSLKGARIVRRWRQGWHVQGDAPGAFVQVVTLDCHSAPGRYAHRQELPNFAVEPVRLPK